MDTARQPVEPLAASLTAREREIVSLVAQKWTNQQIADELVLTRSTVRWYLRQVYAKLGVEGRREAVARAQALGLAAEPSTAQTNLPAAQTPFVGRQDELQTLAEWLLDPHRRVVTIVGPGGMGKTRLALALAERQVARQVPGSAQFLFPDGVWYVSLAPVDNAAGLVGAIAGAAGVPVAQPGDGLRSQERQLLDYLREKKTLLVLDNFEHLADAAPVLGRILAGAPLTKHLVSSRRRLQLQSEQVFRLTGLALPEPRYTTGNGASLATNPAVRLFTDTAQRVQPELSVDETALPAVARICRLLEGMPLAIELAASWASILTPQAIEQEVRRGLDILATELADLPPRHRSMQVTLDLSWERLDDGERALFRRLCVFRGGFDRPAAEEVAGATLAGLQRLVDASWLSHDQAQDRFQIQELLRQYGEVQLEAAPEVARDAGDRHAAYYAAFLQRHERAWYGAAQQKVLAEVRQEFGNVRAAWRRAVVEGRVDLLDAALESLEIFFIRHGDEAAAGPMLRAASESLLHESSTTGDDIARRRLMVRLLAARSAIAESVAEGLVLLDQAGTVLEDLRWEKVDVRREEARLLLERGFHVWETDAQGARVHFAGALERFEQVGDLPGAAKAAQGLAGSVCLLGDYRHAIGPAREALARHRALGNETGVLNIQRMIGAIDRERGRLGAALRAHRDTYLRQRETDKFSAAFGAGALVETLLRAGKYAEADDVAAEATQVVREQGSEWWDTFLRSVTAQVMLHRGRYFEAGREAARVIQRARAAGGRQKLGQALAVAGQAAHATGSHTEALERLEESAAVLAEYRHANWMLPSVYQVYPLLKLGEAARARAVLVDALEAHGEQALFFCGVNFLPAAALLLADGGEVERALELDALARSYPYVANSAWFADVVGGHLAQLAQALDPERAAAAEVQGRARELWATVDQLRTMFCAAASGSGTGGR